MASLRKNSAGKFLVCFRVFGKQFNRDLGTDNQKEADNRVKRIEAIIHDLTTGKIALPADCLDVGTFVMSDGLASAKPTLPVVTTVQNVVDRFLFDADGRVGAETLRQYRKHLSAFAVGFGKRPAESLTVIEAEEYVQKDEWSSSYRNGILGSLVSAYKWAKRAKMIDTEPLFGIKKPGKESRGETALVPAEDHAKICAAADDEFRAYLQLLWLTGARPSEIAGLTADMVNLDQGIIPLAKHKTMHKGKKRTIFLEPLAVSILRQRMLEHPFGFLFPSEDGVQMTAQAIGHRLRRLCVKAKVPHCFPYGYRHSFATDALINEVSDTKVAALMGNSPATLHRHYSHLIARSEELIAATVKVKKSA